MSASAEVRVDERRGDVRWTRFVVVDSEGRQEDGTTAYKKRGTAQRHVDRLNASGFDWHQWRRPFRVVELQAPLNSTPNTISDR